MSAASATAALPHNPDPPPDRAADRAPTQSHADRAATQSRADCAATHAQADQAPTQSRADRVLSVLRKLIGYGQELARTVQQRAAAGTLITVAVHFGTRDVALILARIVRGLRLANALETRLASGPVRLDAIPAVVRAPPPTRARRTARPAVQRPDLPDVPTAEEIAAALRHRPAAAVIADICRDLGIVPSHPLWGEVMMVLSEHGGNYVRYVRNVAVRMCAWLTAPPAADADGWPAPRSQPAAACSTGPP
jgi:hypothetical protein